MQRSTAVSRFEPERTPAAPPDILERREGAARASRMVDALPEKQQEAISLRFEQGLTYKQIADVMSTNVNNVGVLIHAGMKTLRSKLCTDATKQ
jgi:RNA polymerase sigma-70 factor (ECF subfamily)